LGISGKRDEILLRVITECASPFQVVNVEIPERSTVLAAPTVAFDRATHTPEDLGAQDLHALIRHFRDSATSSQIQPQFCIWLD
jgi:hypothetical protein